MNRRAPQLDPTTRRPIVASHRHADTNPSLVVERGSHRGAAVELETSTCIVGRDPDSTLVLADSGVSRQHVKIVRASDGIYNLVDLDSTNGVLINGVRLEVTVLREGDRIHIGPDAVLRFTYHPDTDQAPSPAEPCPLSKRQLEVARLVCKGLSNAAIGKQLGISARTVTSHLDHIYNRIEIGSRAELVYYLTKRGLT